jgi:hypothetical protein
MGSASRVEAWARRAVVVAAALACIATSPAPWYVEAKLPTLPGTSGLGTHLVVEASHEPTVTAKRVVGDHVFNAHRYEEGPWSRRGSYYLPPGVSPTGVTIEGFDCSSGNSGLCSTCQPPVGAFVRIAKAEAVPLWSLSATSDEQITRVATAGGSASFTVAVGASRAVDLAVVITSGAALSSSVWPGGKRDPFSWQTFGVTWSAEEKDSGPIDVHWTARATIYGPCQGVSECRAPENESVKILEVKAR